MVSRLFHLFLQILNSWQIFTWISIHFFKNIWPIFAACDKCAKDPEFQFDKIFDKLQDQDQKISNEFEKLRRENRNDREKINKRISELGKQITDGFAELIENDKKIVENQVKIILMQKFVVEQMDSLQIRLNDLKQQVKLSHLISAYNR